MLERFGCVPLCGALALTIVLIVPDSGARPRPHQEREGKQKIDSAVGTATLSDVITIPDGTPLTLELEEDISAGTAKVGDTVKFTTPFPMRVNGLVIVPKGTAVSGSVAQVSHPRRGGRDGQVEVAIEKLNLPSGKLVTLRLRKSGNKQPRQMKDDGHPADVWGLLWRAPLDPLTGVIAFPIFAATKGIARNYSAGTWVTAYFDGLVNLDRDALMKLQPPPYLGPPLVYFTYHHWGDGTYIQLYCSQKLVEFHLTAMRLKLKPGTYSFSNDRKNRNAVVLDVQENHQYWIEREHGRLSLKDSPDNLIKMDEIEGAPWVRKSDFSSPFAEDSCPQLAKP
jgi:hypothetical protein